MQSSTSTSLPPRLSTRLLLSLYGEQRCDNVNQLVVQRKKMLTEIDNADVTKSLTLDMFLYPSMNADLTQKIKRAYMAFLKEVSAVEAGNNHPNAAKTMYSMIVRNNNTSTEDIATKQLTAQREAISYFGHISDAQFDSLWKLGEELQRHAVKTEKETMNSVPFGHDIVFPSSLTIDAPSTWASYFSLFDGADVFENARVAVRENNLSTPTAAAKTSNKPAEDPHASTRAWLTQLCATHLQMFPSSVLDAPQLLDGLVRCCTEQAGTGDDGALQMLLFDLVGEEGFDLMLEVIQNKTRIVAMGKAPVTTTSANATAQSSGASVAVAPSVSARAGAAAAGDCVVDGGVSAEDLAAIRAAEQEDIYQQDWPDVDTGPGVSDEHLSANQRRKRELKRAREMERVTQSTSAEQGNYSFLQGHSDGATPAGIAVPDILKLKIQIILLMIACIVHTHIYIFRRRCR